MSIKKYTNIDSINTNLDNQGKFIQDVDLFILSKNEIEKTEFGLGKYDVMEVSVYDINNVLLPQKSGNNVAYIKRGDIQNYLYNITNKGGQKELAINVEKLLNELGFTNGILKVNINFVRNRVGNDNELTRVWIQEISPSREEIRILPLKTKDQNINNITNYQFKALKSLNKEFLYYKEELLKNLNSFDNKFLSNIDSYLETQFGKDFFNVTKKDFGLSNFTNLRNKIFEDFKTSVTYYLTNKYYNISQSNFGKQDEIRFDDYEVYDFEMLLSEIQKILFGCIEYNLKVLKRRNIQINKLPKEFEITELKKLIQNNIESFSTFTQVNRNVYNPDKINVIFDDKDTTTPIKPGVIVETPPVFVSPTTPDIRPGGGSGGGGGYTAGGDTNDGRIMDRREMGRMENFR
jgi:hypothetical protein